MDNTKNKNRNRNGDKNKNENNYIVKKSKNNFG